MNPKINVFLERKGIPSAAELRVSLLQAVEQLDATLASTAPQPTGEIVRAANGRKCAMIIVREVDEYLARRPWAADVVYTALCMLDALGVPLPRPLVDAPSHNTFLPRSPLQVYGARVSAVLGVPGPGENEPVN